jgi:hypothetical protein
MSSSMSFPVGRNLRLDHYGGLFVLSVLCKECRHEKLVAASAFLRHVRRDTHVSEVVKRLRCSKCRTRNVDVLVTGIPR